MKITSIIVISYLSLFANEQVLHRDNNSTATTYQSQNTMPQKTINFFNGIVNDFKEFTAHNKLIEPETKKESN